MTSTINVYDPDLDGMCENFGKLIVDDRETYNINEPPIKEDQIILRTVDYFRKTFHYPDITDSLLHAFNHWIKAPRIKCQRTHDRFYVWRITQLILNDVVFEKKTRQGKDTVAVAFGIPDTLNAYFFGGLSSTWVNQELLAKSIEITTHMTTKSCRSRGILMSLREKLICPNEKLYFRVCGFKNCLFKFVEEVETLQELYGERNEKMLELANDIVKFLTIVDECRRLALDCTDDITDGYFSFPIMYTINNEKDNNALILNMMRQRLANPILLNTALDIIKASGCFDYAKETLKTLKNDILRMSKQFGHNPAIMKFFDEYLQIPEDFASVKYELP